MNKLLSILVVILLIYSGITTYKLVNSKPKIISSTIISYDTITHESVKLYPKPYKIEIHDTTYIPKDSVQCVDDYKELYRKYSSIKYTRDTLQNDTSGTIIVGTKISRNNIDSIGVKFKNNRPTSITNNIIKYPDQSKLSIGLIGGYQSIIPFLQYDISSKLGVQGGYNLYNNSINIGLKYTILNK